MMSSYGKAAFCSSDAGQSFFYCLRKKHDEKAVTMSCAKHTRLFAYVSISYLIASVLYLAMTFLFVGAPFRDSLTKEQLKIKAISANRRRSIFVVSMVVSIIAIAIWRPF